MTTKKYRTPKAKPGQLKIQWGKLPHDNPDLCVVWGGDGASEMDGKLLLYAFTSYHYDFLEKKWNNSVLDDLKKRGYDITTLKVSIEKKENKDHEQ